MFHVVEELTAPIFIMTKLVLLDAESFQAHRILRQYVPVKCQKM
jgi:hypothetical protein